VRVTADLPVLHADLLYTQLHAYASPRRDHLDQDKLGVARLGSGHAISAGEARRLACTAGIMPMVLSGASQPLDVGRARRFHTPAMRTALALRDRECRATGCDIPAAWCEAHHLVPWAKGGTTRLDDGVLLCGFHHHRAHDHRYQTSRLRNGDIRFHRRR
jgi:hypothetical protein